MGRNLKKGLDYFPLDIDFFDDEKVLFVSSKYGLKGDAILIRLLVRIYRQGYSLKWDDNIALLFALSAGDINELNIVKNVVNECFKWEFFDPDIFKKFGLLTSRGIQKRYSKICQDAKRKNWEIPQNIDLLNLKKSFTPEEMPNTPEESTQRKGKKSKEEDITNVIKIIMPFESIEFKTLWQDWKDYKKASHKFQYGTQKSEQIALNQIQEFSKGHEVVANAIITNSISSGYKGFFELKDFEFQKLITTVSHSNPQMIIT